MGQLAQPTTTTASDINTLPVSESSDFLKKLADRTGGRFFSTNSADNTKTVVKINDELRNTYVLGYYPTNTSAKNGRRKIKLELRNHPKAALRYKKA